ncbi:MAG: Response regulator [Ignavibacteria bacterium]|nr:Response regulator [Ignavibacteria bacterium]
MLEDFSNIEPTQKRLLIVDDETLYLKILHKMLEKHYEVQTASSGAQALEILKAGFNPGVILSDQKMPNMTGDEFLEKSIQIVPDSVRIILTGYTNPKDIIPCVNRGHAYMFLTKPAEEFEIVQAIKLGFSQYFTTIRTNNTMRHLRNEVNQKTKELKTATDNLSNQIDLNKAIFNQVIQLLSGIISSTEKYYFTNHSQYVMLIAKVIAERLGFESGRITDVVVSSLLHNISLVYLPTNLQFIDPYDSKDDNELLLFFDAFTNSVLNLQKFQLLKKHSRIISQIWEHHDGSGRPNALVGNLIEREAVIIGIANIYHNAVYRIQPESYPQLLETGEVVQTKDETKRRHDDIIKFLFRKASWFDLEVFEIFNEFIKRRRIPELIPSEETLVLKLKEENEMGPDGTIAPKGGAEAFGINISKSRKPIEKEILVSELEPGMIIMANISTKSGILVVKQESVADVNLIKNLKQLENSGLIYSAINVLIPVPD